MKRSGFFLVVLLGIVLPCLSPAGQGPAKKSRPKVIVNPVQPRPGDIVTVTVKRASAPLEGRFGDQKIYFYPSKDSFKAVFGVDLYTKPGNYPLRISANGRVFSRKLKIIKKKYPVQRLRLPDDMVQLSPENEARVERENKRISALWPNETDRIWAGSFMNPRIGRISTRFGLRRIINGIPKSSHSGVDVAADEGDEVYAPNNGIVALVDDYFFSGNSVFLDHGQGIYTMFFHLSKILVTEGQQVKKGDVIALVGSTGRSTGAHLHWGVRVQGARVNPLSLIKLKLD